MEQNEKHLAEEYIKLSFGIEEHMPGYVDAYFGPEEWQAQAKQDGKLPLQNLTERTARLANNISHADNMDAQRKDFLARQVTAMQMSLRLLEGENVSLEEEVKAIYDVQPEWKDEANFEEANKELDSLLPPGDSLPERMQIWKKSLEIPIEKIQELLPTVSKRLRDITDQKFNLPKDESFILEWVSDKPWAAYNWYLGNYRSRIDISTDSPMRVNELAELLAHEGYPGHHTELSIKEKKLIQEKKYTEHTIALINSPSCVVSEGIATTALKTALADDELEDWYREEILPRAGMSNIDPRRLLEIEKTRMKRGGVMGNISFMLYDQHKSEGDVSRYLQKYALLTEKEAQQNIRFVSDPLSRSYVFTYDIGHELLEELFIHLDRDKYFKHILEEPVTPSQIRQWILTNSTSN
jgi:hypothetical protein